MSSTTDLPNVLLIMMDTARADAFEPYGAPLGSTPAVADLARRGGARQAYAPANWTVPSHASLFSGLLPRTTGLTQVPGEGPGSCRASLVGARRRLLPVVLRAHGYDTRGISANPWVSRHVGFDLGFDQFVDLPPERRTRMADTSPRGRLRWALEAFVARADDGASAALAEIDRWLDEGPRRPFFWFVNLLECHSPYLPPRPFNSLNPLQRMFAALEAQRHLSFEAVVTTCLGLVEIPAAAYARMRQLYADAIGALDHWVSVVLERLETAGLLDDTQIIVTSDHGENLGESGLIGHAYSLDERLLRVPFVTAGPLSGLDSGDLMSLVSVPGLLAEAIGIDRHPWTEVETGGAIVVGQCDAAAPKGDPVYEVMADRWKVPVASLERAWTTLTTASDGSYKLQVAGDHEAVFDLSSDPLETTPLPVASAGPALAPLRRAVGDALTPDPRLIIQPGDAVVDAPTPTAAEVARLEEQMKMLGYM